jgi:alpha-1,6-mannosyltransferase
VYAAATLLWLPFRRRVVPLAVALLLGFALRAMFLIPDPALSGDVYRYVSDGRRLASGHNPYTYTPDDPRINHPEIRSIYPPLAQLLFAQFEQPHLILYGQPSSGAAFFVWKLILLASDLGAIVLLRRSGAALAFALCPLVLFEGAWNGHIDALAAVFLAIALARRSSLAAAIAAGLKVIPLAAVPALRRTGGLRLPRFIFFLLVPFYFFLGGPIMPGFHDYATRWIFNSPLYDLTRAIVSRVNTKEIWTHHPLRFALVSDVVYRHVDPDFITRAILATLAVGGILLARRVTTSVAALLVCSPAIHPWYWLTLVPAAFLERGVRLALAFALCAPFSYLLYAHAPALLVYALCYGIPLVTLWRD